VYKITSILKCFSAIVAVATVASFPSTVSAQQALYPLKEGIVQPFNYQNMPSWVKLDFELRARTEDQSSLTEVQNKDRAYELTRVWGGVTVVPTSWLTFYGQFLDTHALGLPLNDTASNMRDVFDLRQGYLNFHYKPAQLLVGRFEMRIGDERVVGISDWTNNSRTWDGAYLRIGSVNQLNIFTTSVVTVHPSSLDTHGAGLTFHGVHAKLATYVPHTVIEPFVLIKAEPSVKGLEGGAGTETEVTFGSYYNTHWYGFDSSGTGMLQRGSYGADSIESGAGIVRAGYGAERLPLKPHLEYEYDYATGNDHSNLNHWSTFDQQYPSSHNAFGLVDLFGFQNMKQQRVNLQLTPKENFLVLLQGGSLHVATVHDAVYNGAGASFIPVPTATGAFKGDGIGSEFDASAKYIYKKSFVTNLGVGHFFPGEVVVQGEPAKHAPLTYAYIGFTYRFKVQHDDTLTPMIK
jgi:hypothetical protein